MKKLVVCLLSACLCLGLFAACDKTEVTPEAPVLSGIEVSAQFFDAKVVLKGTELPATFSAVPVFSDKSKGEAVTILESGISGYNKNQTGEQTVKVAYQGKAAEFKIIVADVIATTSAQLSAAIDGLTNNQYIAVKGGEYDMPRSTKQFNDQDGWYFLIDKSGVTIKGIDNPVLTSTTQSQNAGWSAQNFITVTANNVTLDGLTIKSKTETNKAIEVVDANNFKMNNVSIVANGAYSKFAGSVLFNINSVNYAATITSSTLNYGRISLSNCVNSFTLNLVDTNINFAGADDGATYATGYTTESWLWGLFNPLGCPVVANNSIITVSPEALACLDYQTAFAAKLPASGLTVKLA